jgi:hypothetical protein
MVGEGRNSRVLAGCTDDAQFASVQTGSARPRASSARSQCFRQSPPP